MTLLKVNNIHAYYGNIHALKGISLEVNEGEIVSLIGSNGAGKTTTLRSISGLMSLREGDISFNGNDIRNYQSHDLVGRGIAMVPEGRGVFAKMSVAENLELGAYCRDDNEIVSDMERIYTLFPRLAERKTQLAGTMSGGEQQMLAMGRAMMARPKLLLLDEPSMGLAPILVELIFDTIKELNETTGTTILLVEQNAHMSLQVSHRGYVLQTGEIVTKGDAKELQQDESIKKAYLGIE